MNTQALSLMCSLQQQLTLRVFYNTCPCACLYLAPLRTQRGNPKPHSGCDSLSPPLCGGLEQGAGRSVQCGPCRGEQQGPCAGLWEEAAAQLLSSLQAWAALDVPSEMRKHLRDTFFRCVAAVGQQASRGVSRWQTRVIRLRGLDLAK